jgi:RNA polymerase sigma factor (sigma-70 family)
MRPATVTVEPAESRPIATGQPIGTELARYEALFRAQFAFVARSAYLVIHDVDAAQDAAQEAFSRLFREWPKVSRYDSPEAWVRRVAIRLAVRAAQRRRVLDRLLPWLSHPASPQSGGDVDLANALGRLPPRQRAAIALHYYEGRPLTEVASLLGCSHSTAKVHLFKARQRLAQLLNETEEASDGHR